MYDASMCIESEAARPSLGLKDLQVSTYQSRIPYVDIHCQCGKQLNDALTITSDRLSGSMLEYSHTVKQHQ